MGAQLNSRHRLREATSQVVAVDDGAGRSDHGSMELTLAPFSENAVLERGSERHIEGTGPELASASLEDDPSYEPGALVAIV